MTDDDSTGRAAVRGLAHCIGAGVLAGFAASLLLAAAVLALHAGA